MNHERLDLTLEEREVQNRRLNDFFGNYPIEEMTAILPAWQVESGDLDRRTKTQRHKLIKGSTEFDFVTANEWAFLKWTSATPNYLRPSRHEEDARNFLEFLFGTLPATIHGLNPDEDYFSDYVQYSKIYLTSKQKEDARVGYALKSKDDMDKFIKDFTRDPDNIKTITVNGRAGEDESLGEFQLDLAYPENSTNYVGVSLGLPLKPMTVDGWNADTLSWALETHMYKRGMEDLEIETFYLHQGIMPIAERAMISNSPQP